MTTKKDGGPAFPRTCGHCGSDVAGMSLRDFFAGMALQSYMASYHNDHVHVIKGIEIPEVAETAYKIADAFLEEREKNEQAD